ncbi:hypothetical protein GCM10023158_20930 [Gluconacetobacter tumulicola]
MKGFSGADAGSMLKAVIAGHHRIEGNDVNRLCLRAIEHLTTISDNADFMLAAFEECDK